MFEIDVQPLCGAQPLDEPLPRLLLLLEGALEAAGEKDVDVFSASIGQQLLRSGRIDEVCIHLASVLLGWGTPLFDSGDTHIRLELIETRGGPKATHLTYDVIQT